MDENKNFNKKHVNKDFNKKKSRMKAMPVSKDQLKNYLKTFIEVYRSHIKKEYPGYFNEFPFCGALKAIGVITHNKVYFIFTKDGNPKQTTFEVFDENDLPALLRVKNARENKLYDICGLLGLKTYIPDLTWGHHYIQRMSPSNVDYFNDENASGCALDSVRYHYSYVENEKDPTVVLKGEAVPPSILPKFDFVYNTLDERVLRNKIEEIFDKAEEGEEILIAGWIGSFAIPFLKSLEKKKVRFRIVTHRPPPPEKGKSPSDEYVVFTEILTKKIPENVRILTKLHARLVISDKEALVSTADLTKDSQEGKYEAGITTTDGVTIQRLKQFFEEMWETAKKLRTGKEPPKRRLKMRTVYDEIVSDFLESGERYAEVSVEGKKHATVFSELRKRAKEKGILVKSIGGKVYLERT